MKNLTLVSSLIVICFQFLVFYSIASEKVADDDGFEVCRGTAHIG